MNKIIGLQDFQDDDDLIKRTFREEDYVEIIGIRLIVISALCINRQIMSQNHTQNHSLYHLYSTTKNILIILIRFNEITKATQIFRLLRFYVGDLTRVQGFSS